MIRTEVKKSFIFTLLAGMMFTGAGGKCIASEPMVLIVRPEMLQNQQKSRIAPENIKDIFAWPVIEPQVEAIEEQEAQEMAQQAFDQLQLEAIFWHKTNPQAIINGRLVATGEKIEGILVQEIRKGSILLKLEEFLHTLEFEEQTILLGPVNPSAPGKASATTGP